MGNIKSCSESSHLLVSVKMTAESLNPVSVVRALSCACADEVVEAMRQVPLECDINIAVNGRSGFATSTQKGPFMAMLISRSRGTYLIVHCLIVQRNKDEAINVFPSIYEALAIALEHGIPDLAFLIRDVWGVDF